MAADDLAPCVTRSSPAIIWLSVRYVDILVFFGSEFYQPVMIWYRGMMWKGNIFFVFSEKFSLASGSVCYLDIQPCTVHRMFTLEQWETYSLYVWGVGQN